MSDAVRTERRGKTLVVYIDNPPVNAGSLDVRRGLIGAINELSEDSTLTAGVLIGAGSTFIAGSDLREFGQPLEAPELPAVIAVPPDPRSERGGLAHHALAGRGCFHIEFGAGTVEED